MTDLATLITSHNHPELAEIDGDMVYQVWEDGEITLTKAGRLLGQRGLHMIEGGRVDKAVDPNLFPNVTKQNHGFIYTDDKGSQAVRQAILQQEATTNV